MSGIRVISDGVMRDLCEASRVAARGRQHLNLHLSYDDPMQRLLNVIQPGSYIRPHRHMLEPRLESLFVLMGRLVLITFGEDGSAKDLILMVAGDSKVSGATLGVELHPGVWHTVVALDPDSVLLELKAGPFNPQAAKEPAPWAPAEGAADAVEYMNSLQRLCDRYR